MSLEFFWDLIRVWGPEVFSLAINRMCLRVESPPKKSNRRGADADREFKRGAASAVSLFSLVRLYGYVSSQWSLGVSCSELAELGLFGLVQEHKSTTSTTSIQWFGLVLT
jgi:hypothetical protein